MLHTADSPSEAKIVVHHQSQSNKCNLLVGPSASHYWQGTPRLLTSPGLLGMDIGMHIYNFINHTAAVY